MNVVEISSLTRRFGELVAVDRLSLGIGGGEVFGLLGPNGAGKSTVVKMLTTLLSPSGGQAAIAGYDIQHQKRRVRASIGYVPQLLSADGMLSGYENLLIFAKLYSVPRAERQGRIATALQSAGLTDAAHRLVRQYSGGMIRRLELSIALIHRPRVLFLDEPTVGLDPIARHAVWQQIQRLVAEHGTTVLLTTHFMDEADVLCDRIGIMNLGKLCALGPPAELKASLGQESATLDDVFVHYAGGSLIETPTEGGQFRDVAQNRRAAARRG
ncbi:MAG TPA: ATP-binding cassette domain-containing protein [Tepidisphaeraceae bacterium]|jgi:ABC-2 type transport system ATP-binding protein|nr:ATP-binding cassette domain-containing protein [Tepidisphaeraceae bacterium]